MPEAGQFLAQPHGGEGLAQQTIVQGTAPGAGANYALTLDPTYVWRPVACVFTLTTAVAAANRYPTVQYQRGSGEVFCVNGAGVTVSASSVQRFAGSMHQSVGQWAANTDVFFPLAPLYLHGGDVLAINVAAIQAADTLTLIQLVFDRFYESYPA